MKIGAVVITSGGDELIYHADIIAKELEEFEAKFPTLKHTWGSTHAVCGGWVDWIKTRADIQVVRCRHCGLRVEFPLTITTVKELIDVAPHSEGKE